MKEVSVDYRLAVFSSLICEEITSTDEVRSLLDGSNYFFGTVATNYEDPGSSRAFFSSGPDHRIFELAVLKDSELPPGVSLQECQLGVRRIGADKIAAVMFKFDPARLKGNISPDEQDPTTSQRRIGVIRSLVGKLSPDVCEPRIIIGSYSNDCPHYSYLPQTRQLLKGL